MDIDQLAAYYAQELGNPGGSNADQARIEALRKQQMIGAMGGVMDVPGVQKMGQLMFQDASRQLNPSTGLDDMLKILALQNTQANQEGNRQLRQAQMAATAEERAARAAERGERQLYTDIQRLDKTIGDPLMDLVQSTADIRTQLAPYKPDAEGNVDLPGYGKVEQWVPGWAVGEEGRALRSTVQGLENKLLKARSGGAVSVPEAERLGVELQTAKSATTERELIAALNRFAAGLDAALQRKLSTAPPEARERYLLEGNVPSRVEPVYQFEDEGPPIKLPPRQGR